MFFEEDLQSQISFVGEAPFSNSIQKVSPALDSKGFAEIEKGDLENELSFVKQPYFFKGLELAQVCQLALVCKEVSMNQLSCCEPASLLLFFFRTIFKELAQM